MTNLINNHYNSHGYTTVLYYKTESAQLTQNDFLILKASGNLIIEKWILNQSFPLVNCTKFSRVHERNFEKEVTFTIDSTQLISVITFLKKASYFYYEQLIDISAIDNYKEELRFEVVYQLLSITHSKRLTLSASLTEGSGVESVVTLYPSAGWYERETWDRFGVFFYNHPDLRRRLTDYGFKGHPLRKDFPLTGFLEVRYNTNIKSISYEKVSLAQAFREVKVSNF